MLNKIYKKMQDQKSESDEKVGSQEPTYQQFSKNERTGFHAKKDSTVGAARARSIGNRNNKPSRAK